MLTQKSIPAIATGVCLVLIVALTSSCGTLEIGIAPAPGTATRVTAIETRGVTPATQGSTEETATAAPTLVPSGHEAKPTLIPAPTTLHVVFTRDDNAWLWVEGTEPRQLTRRGGVGQVRISGDGGVVAFSRGGELWMVRDDGTDERPLVSIDDLETIRQAMSLEEDVLLHSFKWVPGTHTVVFNTRVDAQIGLVLNDDLRKADADSGALELLLPPGDGGEVYPSPDGSQLAVVSPGSISAVGPDGRGLRLLFTYTPVATASEFRYYAVPVWAADSSHLRVVVPPANPFSTPPAPSTVWHIPVSGDGPSLMGDVEMALASQPAFSQDLRYLAHQVGNASGLGEQRTSLLITDLDLRGSITYFPESRAGVPYELDGGEVITHHAQVGAIYGWAQDGRHLAFGAQIDPSLPFQAQIGEIAGSITPAMTDVEGAVIDLSWVDSARFLFVAQGSRGWTIMLGEVGGWTAPVASVGGQGPPPAYDFAAPRAAIAGDDAGAQTDDALPEGLVYETPEGLWLVGETGAPGLVFARSGAEISPGGNEVLYVESDDIWIANLETGESRNMTGTPDRLECCPQWWPGQPDRILFNSWTPEEDGPSYGSPTVAELGMPDYRVLDDAETSYSLPAPSPDGQTVAYDRAGKAWLFVDGAQPRPFDPSVYGLAVSYGSPGEVTWRIVSPSWAPDGTMLAWVVSECGEDGCETRTGIFDLEEETAQLLLPHQPVGRGGQPPAAVWSPDGQWLAVATWAEDPGKAGLWVVGADGEGEHPLVTGLLRADPTPVWSPDGRWLAFGSPRKDGEGQEYWLAVPGKWDRVPLDLPAGARLVAWLG